MDLFYVLKSLIPVALKSSLVPHAWFLMSFISERNQGSFEKCLMLGVGGKGVQDGPVHLGARREEVLGQCGARAPEVPKAGII